MTRSAVYRSRIRIPAMLPRGQDPIRAAVRRRFRGLSSRYMGRGGLPIADCTETRGRRVPGPSGPARPYAVGSAARRTDGPGPPARLALALPDPRAIDLPDLELPRRDARGGGGGSPRVRPL